MNQWNACSLHTLGAVEPSTGMSQVTFLTNYSWIFFCFVLIFRYVIECPNCGVIYRSRQYWYGNQDPVDTVVRTEIQHVWPGVRGTCYSLFIAYPHIVAFILRDAASQLIAGLHQKQFIFRILSQQSLGVRNSNQHCNVMECNFQIPIAEI